MAARDIHNIKEDFLVCAICLDGYADPRELPCSHSFCLECLETHINENPRSYGFECPSCRRKIRLARSGNAASVAASFPRNNFLEDIRKRVKLHESGAPSCNQHKEKPAEYFCCTDDVLLCPDCVISLHRKAVCDVVPVEDAHTKLKPECEKMKTQCAEKTAQLRNMLTDHFKDSLTEEIKTKTLHDIKKVEQKLGEFYDHTIESINQFKEELNNSENVLPTNYDSRVNLIINDLVNSKRYLDKLDERSNWLEKFQKFKRKWKSFIYNIDHTIKHSSGTIFRENVASTRLFQTRVPIGTIERQCFSTKPSAPRPLPRYATQPTKRRDYQIWL